MTPVYIKPLPVPSNESAPFWEGCRRHELLIQRCDECGQFAFPPAAHCPECFHSPMKWSKVSGQGKVYTFVVYRRSYHPGFEADLPYVVALVQLEEGPRLIGNIVGCDPQSVRCEMPVEVVFDDIEEKNFTLYRFRGVQS